MFETKEYQEYVVDQVNDNLAPGYDKVYLDHLKNDVLPSFDFKGAEVLDVGARAFESWDWFRANYEKDITGIDIGREGLDFCKEKNKTGIIELDAHRMLEKFTENQFDLVLAFHSFEHMYDLPLVLKNCFHVLKPGGHLYFALPYRSFNWKKGHWYDVQDDKHMLQLCVNAGFTTVHSEVISDYKYRPEKETLGVVRK